MNIKTKSSCAIAALFCLFASSPAFSTMVTLTDFKVWTTTFGNDVIRITTGTSRVNPAGCADPDSYMVQETLSKEAKTRIYGALLAARLAGKPVEVWVSDTTCQSGRPAIDTVITP